MSKVRYFCIMYDGVKHHEQHHFYCPGCKMIHAVGLQVHKFNNNLDKPTFDPSILCNWVPERVCHSYVKDGNIQFLTDCFHELAGKTVELPEFTDDMSTYKYPVTNWDD